MSRKQPKESGVKKDPPLDALRSDIEANYLITDAPSSTRARFIEKVEVRPQQQSRIFLGSFTADNPPKGFSIELSPDPEPPGSVVTEVTNLGTSKKYELVLHVANYGNKSAVAEVWQL